MNEPVELRLAEGRLAALAWGDAGRPTRPSAKCTFLWTKYRSFDVYCLRSILM